MTILFQPPANGPRLTKEVQRPAGGAVEGRGGETEVGLPNEPRHAWHLQPKAAGKSTQWKSVHGDPQKRRGHLRNSSFKFDVHVQVQNFEFEWLFQLSRSNTKEISSFSRFLYVDYKLTLLQIVQSHLFVYNLNFATLVGLNFIRQRSLDQMK